jgi:hypothetical protein
MKQRTINHEQKVHAALDPGNKILDEGKGKNNTRAHFIKTTPDATSTLPKPDQTNADETTGLLPGLAAPKLQVTGKPVKGNDRRRHREENKQKRRLQQTIQRNETYWTMHKGEVQLTEVTTDRPQYQNSMCPTDLALEHPAASMLQEYATYGCLAKTGKKWTKAEILEAVERGPHVSALLVDALEHFKEEARAKVATGHTTIVDWDTIKHNPHHK